MKKILTTIILLATIALNAFAQQYDPESDFTVAVISNGSAVRITGYVGKNTVVRIPPRIRNLPVTEIGEDAFEQKGLTNVTIPNSVIIIGKGAFYENNLVNVTIPNSVTIIAELAFMENEITSVTLSNSITTIGEMAFANNQLNTITIPNSVISIGDSAFQDNKLISLTIGNSVTSIGEGAFLENQLTSVIIPNRVTSIGMAAFRINQISIVLILSNSINIHQTAFDNNPVPKFFDIRSFSAANNPKLADQKLGAAVLQELQILRFLADTAAVNRHEAVLKFITDRGNATRAEIEKFYRDNIRALIAAVVDEEFNKVSFLIENRSSTHTSTLIRNPQNGHLTLNYGGTYTNNETRTITAASLEALASEMGRRTSDFDQTGINAVRAQAALIPAVALSDTALNEAKAILTNFYLSQNNETYLAMKEAYTLYDRTLLQTKKAIFENIRIGYSNTISALNSGLASKVITDTPPRTYTVLTREQQQRLVQLR